MRSTPAFRFFLALFGLTLCVSISATEICFGALLLWWLIDVKRAGPSAHWKSAPLTVPIFVFFAWSVFCVVAQRPGEWAKAVWAPSALLLFYWASQRLSSDEVDGLFRWM